MNKRNMILIFLFFVILWIVWIIFIFPKDSFNADSELNQEIKIESLGKCGGLDDEKADLLSIEKSDIIYCDCIEDKNIKIACKQKSTDLSFYTNAIEQLDIELCKNIIDKKVKKKCEYSLNKELKRLEGETLYLANKFQASHNLDKAIEQFEKLLESNPKKVEYMLNIAQVYAEKWLKQQEQWKDQIPYVEKALWWIEKAEKLDPKNPDVYRVKGYIYEIKPDPLKAISFYDKALELDNRFIPAYLWRAHSYNMLGIMDKALADLEKASSIDIKNEYLTIYSQLCRMQASRDDLLEDAIKNCRIIVDAPTTDTMFKSESYQILAGLYMKAEQLDDAESLLLKAKSMTPNDPNLYVQFAELYIKKWWNMSEAEQMASKCRELAPTKAACLEKLAYSVYQQERFDEAIEIALEGIELVDGDVSLLKPNKNLMKKNFYYTLANVYYYKKDSENEMKYLEMWDNLFK